MKRNLGLGISIAILGASLSLPAFGAVKAGASCSKAGLNSTIAGKKFTCIKSGKRLVWNKGVQVAIPTPKASPAAASEPNAITPAPSESKSPESKPANTAVSYPAPSVPSANVDLCKIKENNANRNNSLFVLATGFPGNTSLATKTGTVKWALIPIDFPDMKGEPNFKSRVDSQMKQLSEWFAIVSEGKFKVEWVVSDNWVTLPGNTTQYGIPQSVNLDKAANGPKLFQDAMTAADPVFNFSNIQTVNFILPAGQKFVGESSQGFPWDAAVKEMTTNEGKISSFSIPGDFFDQLNRQYWSYWAHEFGHAMGVPHIGSSRDPNPYMNLDIMGNQDGYTKELSGWNRFVNGWLDDKRVYCQELSKLNTTELSLVPLSDSTDGVKMAVVPVSESKAIVIESRRETQFACSMPSKKNGVLVYLYDATKSHGENFLIPVTQTGRSNESSSNCPVVPYPDPLLYKDQKISIEGVTIEVLESKELDKIRLTRG
jgi:M6 family metalloprotease-like protein